MRDMKRRVRTCFVTGLLGVIGFLAGGTHVAAQTCLGPPPGLVGWWAGEGDANDKWGGYNGELVGPIAFEAGEVAEAFDVEEGEDDSTFGYVRVPHDASLTFNGSYTVELWMRTDGANEGAPTLVEKYAASPDPYPFAVRLNTGDSRFSSVGPRGTIFCGAFDSVHSPYVWSSTDMLVDDNAFHHVACVYDFESASKSITVYVDGQEAGKEVVGTPVDDSNNDDDLFFGIRGNLGVNSYLTEFDGLLDEISLYSRALSASEIEGIYQAGTDGKCIAPAHIEDLIQDVQGLTLSGNSGVSQLNAALGALAQDPADIQGAIDALEDFINYVSAQSGKKISFEDAANLIDAAQAAIDSLS